MPWNTNKYNIKAASMNSIHTRTSYAGCMSERSCSICLGSTWSTSWNSWSLWDAVTHRGHNSSLQSPQKYSNCLWCSLQRVLVALIEGLVVLLRCKASRATFLSSSDTILTKRFRLKLVLSSLAFPVVSSVTWRQLGHSSSRLFWASTPNLLLTVTILSKHSLQNEWAHRSTFGSRKKSKQTAQINSSRILVLKVPFLDIVHKVSPTLSSIAVNGLVFALWANLLNWCCFKGGACRVGTCREALWTRIRDDYCTIALFWWVKERG